MRTASVPAAGGNPAKRLLRRLGTDHAALFVFASPDADFPALARGLALPEGGAVVACTTAGEIHGGYVEGEIVGIGLPREHFACATVEVPDLDRIDPTRLIDSVIRARRRLEAERSGFRNEFAFLLVDGTSAREDMLMDALSHALGPVPVFGGSAGDGTRFRQSLVAHGTRVMERAAVLTLVRTDCPVEVFSFHHLEPGTRRMVVTGADPAARLVTEINAEPAAKEYARQLGKDPANLDPFTFAAHPLVVRVGTQFYVRSIQRITEEGHLKFFSAIDEGVVLTLADLKDIARELERDLAGLSRGRALQHIIACDCILRRIAAEQSQRARDVSAMLRRFHVSGFSTYGEQVGAMHVNLTLTGVAIFAPEAPAADAPVPEAPVPA